MVKRFLIFFEPNDLIRQLNSKSSRIDRLHMDGAVLKDFILTPGERLLSESFDRVSGPIFNWIQLKDNSGGSIN